MRILGIETSCDETAAAVVRGGRILSNVVSSQVDLHRRYRGIVPELASRAHLEKIVPVVDLALANARCASPDAVAFTQGPGLAGSLLVGKVAAQTLARLWGVPLLGVNHLEGHVFASELDAPDLRYPLVALVVSGGHTDLIFSGRPGSYRVLGRTRDDAAGEAFDKVARMLGLGYPGGPRIDRLAKIGDPAAVAFPRPLLPGVWDFSFSGLKTAVLYHIQRSGPPSGSALPDVCASFQEAVVDTLARKARAAALACGARQLVVGGGVAANSRLRERLLSLEDSGLEVRVPPPRLCTDNGAMIAQAAARRLAGRGRAGGRRGLSPDPAMPMRSWARR